MVVGVVIVAVVVIIAANKPTAAATTITDVLAEARVVLAEARIVLAQALRVGQSFEKQQTSKNSRLGKTAHWKKLQS